MSETVFEAELMAAMLLAHNVAPKSKPIELDLMSASGHILVNDLVALSDLPPFAASRVDGYAVSGPPPWQLTGSNLAGKATEVQLTTGQAMYVATGATLPNATTAIIKQEDCEIASDLISPLESVDAGQYLTLSNVRPRALEAKAGEVLVQAGAKLTPALLGLAAACGHEQVIVHAKPKVDVLIFGDELVQSGLSNNGKVRDSIGPQVKAWLEYLGAELNQTVYVADNLADHISAVTDSTADLVITTGGTASGPADFLHQAITQCGGSILIDAVLVRPGYHQLIAKLPGKFLVGLPGNPQSAVVGLLTLVKPLLWGMTGQSFPSFTSQVSAQDMSAPKLENRFVLCRLDRATGLVSAVEHVDSSMLRGFASADGYAVIKPGGQKAGEKVNWIDLPN